MSATLVVDPKKYTRLANRVVVKAIETEDEYDRMVAAVEHLMDKGEDNLSPEESAFLETMAILVQAYEDRYHPLPPVAPNEMLAYLMETSGRTYQDLLPVLGTRGRVSEALAGCGKTGLIYSAGFSAEFFKLETQARSDPLSSGCMN